MTQYTRDREKYSIDREAIVIGLWPAPVSDRSILAKVNALPGPPLTKHQLGRFANRLGVRRTHKGRDWDKNTPERETMLRVEWPGSKTRREVYAIWLALPGTHGTVDAMESFAVYIGLRRERRQPAPVEAAPPKVEAAEHEPVPADPFSDAIRRAKIVFRDHPDFGARVTMQRQSIMSGKPPDHAKMVAARVAQSRQARGGVGLAFVRGLE
tara:strand:+ start:277 stop:909 length:633 start_codon:yes stop_codon:yes gene_type:complete